MILTLNGRKLLVNIPVSKDGSNWYEGERNIILSKENSLYLEYEHTYFSDCHLWWDNRIDGQEFADNIKFDFASHVAYAYFYYNRMTSYSRIEKYKLLKRVASMFLLYGDDMSKSINLNESVQSYVISKPYEEIDFILSCKDDIVKRDLLRARHNEFAAMYYDIMPNIELKPISEYHISDLENNKENEYKIYTAKENNRVLQLLRK